MLSCLVFVFVCLFLFYAQSPSTVISERLNQAIFVDVFVISVAGFFLFVFSPLLALTEKLSCDFSVK